MEDVVLVTYRYMWLLANDDKNINVKIVTDIDKGHRDFIASLLQLDGISSIAREYLSEYRFSSLGVIEPIFSAALDKDCDDVDNVDDVKES